MTKINKSFKTDFFYLTLGSCDLELFLTRSSLVCKLILINVSSM